MVDRIGHRTLWTFVITSIALVMVTLDNLVVTTALPVIRTDLGASIEGLEWTVNAYTLTFAVFLLTGAALGDRFGRRRMFVVGLGIFTAASALASACAHDRGPRRGAGAAGSRRRHRRPTHVDDSQRGRSGRTPRPRARRLGRHRRSRRRSRSARRWRRDRRTLVAVDLLDQRADRTCAHAAGLATPGRDSRAVVEPRPARPRCSSARACSGSSGASCAATARAGRTLRSSPLWWWELLLVAAFVLWELRAREPMLPMRFFSNRTFSHANVASFFMFFGMFGSIFLLAQFFQTVQGYSPLQAGLRILPWTAMPIFVAPIAGALSDRIGGQRIMGVGLSLQAIGLGWMAAVSTPTVPYAQLVGPFILSGIGMALFFAPVANVVLSSVRPAGGRAGLGRQQRDPRAGRGVRSRGAGLALREVRRLRVRAGVRGRASACRLGRSGARRRRGRGGAHDPRHDARERAPRPEPVFEDA